MTASEKVKRRRTIEVKKMIAMAIVLVATNICWLCVLFDTKESYDQKIRKCEVQIEIYQKAILEGEKAIAESRCEEVKVINLGQQEIAEEKMIPNDLELIAGVVEAEAGIGDYEAKKNVATVIFNRMKSDEFPDTAEDVIMQHEGEKYQFSTVANGSAFEKEPVQETYDAVIDAYNDLNSDSTIILFENMKSNVHESYAEYCFNDGYHKFYRGK